MVFVSLPKLYRQAEKKILNAVKKSQSLLEQNSSHRSESPVFANGTSQKYFNIILYKSACS